MPLLIVGPGIVPGDKCAEAVSLIDIYPTLVQLSQLPENSKLQGMSLAAQLRDPRAPRKQPAITSSYYGNHSIRTRDWRLIVYEDGAEELYNHAEDPEERHNLAMKPAFSEIKQQLAGWLPETAAPEFKQRSERVGRRLSKP